MHSPSNIVFEGHLKEIEKLQNLGKKLTPITTTETVDTSGKDSPQSSDFDIQITKSPSAMRLHV